LGIITAYPRFLGGKTPFFGINTERCGDEKRRPDLIMDGISSRDNLSLRGNTNIRQQVVLDPFFGVWRLFYGLSLCLFLLENRVFSLVCSSLVDMFFLA